jgi:hypothetical protein
VFAVTCSESGSISNRIGGKFESISSSFGYPPTQRQRWAIARRWQVTFSVCGRRLCDLDFGPI